MNGVVVELESLALSVALFLDYLRDFTKLFFLLSGCEQARTYEREVKSTWYSAAERGSSQTLLTLLPSCR